MTRPALLYVAVALAAATGAQPAYSYIESTDQVVSTADAILLGRIASITHPDNDWTKARLEIHVTQVLKGGVGKGVMIDVDPLYSNYIDAYAYDREVMVLYPKESAVPALFVPGSLGKYFSTADFGIIDTADEFMSEVKRLAASNAGPSLGNWIVFPPDTEAGMRWTERFKQPNPTCLIVPIDRNLLARAKEWVKSDDWRVRVEALRVFRYFESPDLVPLLKPLLDDPGYDVRSAEQNNGIEDRLYRVRQEAYRMLVKLGEKVEMPRMEESISRIEEVEVLYWSHIDAGELVVLRQAKRLREFHTYSRAITQDDLRSLASVPTLARIVCDWAGLTDDDLKLLSNMTSLVSLGINSAKVTDASVVTLAQMKNLRFVNMAGSQMTPEGRARLRQLRPDLYIRPPQ